MAHKLLLLLLFTGVLAAQNARQDSLTRFSTWTADELSAQIDDIFNDPNFSNAEWGVVIQSLVTGEYIYKRNENKLFMPASNLKLLTTAAALQVLGKDYRFKTEIYTRGRMDGSILKGDLIIRGFGDPSISGRYYRGDILRVFNNWADSLLELGIDEIQGNIIGDDNAFDDTGLGEGWAWDYESYWFSAQSGALSFNDNCIDLTIKPGALGAKAEVAIMPDNRYTMLINNIRTVHPDSATFIDFVRDRGTNLVTLYGTIAEKSDSQRVYVTVNNPTQFLVVVLKDVLQKKGISLTGYALDADDLNETVDYSIAEKLFTHYSPFLTEIIKVVNKNSQNFFAEQLLKVMGYEAYGRGSAANGLKAARGKYGAMGINTDNCVIVDGSGLSRLNLITPTHLNTVLNYMYRSELFVPYYNSFPVAGRDGTLAGRLTKTRAENNLRGKTGYLGAVRSLAGYIYTADNEPLSYVIILNNFTAPLVLAENLQDLVCLRLANFRRK